MELQKIILSKVTQTQKDKCNMLSLIGDSTSKSSNVGLYPGVNLETRAAKRNHCQGRGARKH